jgi:hypothetical protein
VAQVLRDIKRQYPGLDLPVIAFGASSGGWFVGRSLYPAILDLQVRFDGYISTISAPNPLPHTDDFRAIPVGVYITMSRDEHTEQNALDVIKLLHDREVPAKHISIPPQPITEGFFNSRIPEISMEQSRKLYKALMNAGYLDPSTNLLNEDPRESAWRDVLRPLVPSTTDSFVADESAISEVMNVAFGRHEMSRDGVKEAIEWILEEFPKRPPRE